MSLRYLKCISEGCPFEETPSSLVEAHLTETPTHRIIECWGGDE